MRADLEIIEWDDDAGAAFAAREWTPYNDEHGVNWSPQATRLVAKRQGVPAGMAAYIVLGGLGELKELLVARSFSGGGVGSALIEEFEHRCRSAGCHKARLETADYQARPFYEKHGYRVEATLTNDRFHRTWYVMSKAL